MGRSARQMLLDRRRFEADLDDELRDHLESHVEALVAGGLDRAEAERRARLDFGGVEAVKEECRESAGLAWLFAFGRDLRHGFRLLARSPGFAAVGIALLALAIGANTAVFSVVDGVLFRPLPYPDSERLARVVAADDRDGLQTSLDGRAWEALIDAELPLDLAVHSDWTTGVNFAAAGGARLVRQQRVSAGFFRVLGVEPALGRSFRAEEDVPGGAPVVVLSHALWQEALGGDPAALGRTVTLRGEPYRVIGVMPQGFRSTRRADLWTPLQPSTRGEGSGTNYAVLARVPADREGTGDAGLAGRLAALGAVHFQGERGVAGRQVAFRLEPLRRVMSDGLRRPLTIAWASVGVVLLIGCSNLAGLLLARSAVRSRELATRAAIGGGRGPLLRQLLAEGMALALCGGVAGLGVGWLALLALRGLVDATLALPHDPVLDVRVLAATAALSLASALLFGLYPAWRLSRVELVEALGEGSRSVAGGARSWPRRLLVVAEVALGAVLLVAAVLLVGSLRHLRGVEAGFAPEGLVAATVSLDDARYRTAAAVDRLFTRAVAELAGEPAVRGAAATLSLPYERPLNMGVAVAGDAEGHRTTAVIYVTPGSFATLGVPILAGRETAPGDGAAAPPVAVVNRAFFEDRLAGRQPLGTRLLLADREWQVVGIAGNVVQTPGFGTADPLAAVPTVYLPAAQVPDSILPMVHGWFSPSLVARAAGSPADAALALRRAVAAVDPELPVATVQTPAEMVDGALALERFEAVLIATLAGLSLLLAAVGISGLVAAGVAERRREVGLRLALGAGRAATVARAALPGVALALAGLALGALASPLALRALQGMVWGVEPAAPGTALSAAAILVGVAAVASLAPALRVTAVDPATTLRQE